MYSGSVMAFSLFHRIRILELARAVDIILFIKQSLKITAFEESHFSAYIVTIAIWKWSLSH